MTDEYDDDILKVLRTIRIETRDQGERVMTRAADEIERLQEQLKTADTCIKAIQKEVDRRDAEIKQLRAALADAKTLACTSWPNCPVDAETERCAKIAEMVSDTFSSNEDASFRDGEYLTARRITKAIRGKKT